MELTPAFKPRVLVVDDNTSIHQDFERILYQPSGNSLDATKALLLGKPSRSSGNLDLTLESAEQGLEGVELIRSGVEDGNPFQLAFVDVRMPPGIDGVETIQRMWEVDPTLHAVICSAFSDYTWEETIATLGRTDQLLILKKPFDVTVVRQLTTSLLAKCELARQVKRQLHELARETLATRMIIDTCNDAYLELDDQGRIVDWSSQAEQLFGWPRTEVNGKHVDGILTFQSRAKASLSNLFEGLAQQTTGRRVEMIACRRDGVELPVEVSIAPMRLDGYLFFNAFVHDIRERQQLQAQFRHAQQMESVGHLAAGIAHEINTPTQYVGDNMRFVADAFVDLKKVLDAYAQLRQAVEQDDATQQLIIDLQATEQAADLDYLVEEIPAALKQSLEGLERVATIVQAMKTFSHPGQREMTLTDLHEALESTITISRNEWKYVADVETVFAANMPLVACLPGDINQVFLNLIVNAAHAIRDASTADTTKRGTITIDTRVCGHFAEIRISDTGTGIAEENRPHIFDAFFTTKEVGKGTGQGLAIVHSIVVDGHGGTIDLETEVGKGTTFIVRLPLTLQPEREPVGVEALAAIG